MSIKIYRYSLNFLNMYGNFHTGRCRAGIVKKFSKHIAMANKM